MNDKRIVSVTLVGGPDDGDQHEILQMNCRDRLAFVAETWFRFNRDGSVSVVSGPFNKDVAWSQYILNVYKKDGKIKDFEVEYTFEETIAVDRCSYKLKEKNRLCGNEAEYGESYCRVHLKKLTKKPK